MVQLTVFYCPSWNNIYSSSITVTSVESEGSILISSTHGPTGTGPSCGLRTYELEVNERTTNDRFDILFLFAKVEDAEWVHVAEVAFINAETSDQPTHLQRFFANTTNVSMGSISTSSTTVLDTLTSIIILCTPHCSQSQSSQYLQTINTTISLKQTTVTHTSTTQLHPVKSLGLRSSQLPSCKKTHTQTRIP